MNEWIESHDGWFYSQDGLQRWRRRGDGLGQQVESCCLGLPEEHPQFDQQQVTQSQFQEECDVNVILERLIPQRGLPELKQGVYGDFSELPSYQEAVAIQSRAHDSFMKLPGKLRARFDNDPQKFMDFIHSDKEEDLKESYDLGFRQKPVVPKDPNQSVVDSISNLAKAIKPTKKPVSKD